MVRYGEGGSNAPFIFVKYFCFIFLLTFAKNNRTMSKKKDTEICVFSEKHKVLNVHFLKDVNEFEIETLHDNLFFDKEKAKEILTFLLKYCADELTTKDKKEIQSLLDQKQTSQTPFSNPIAQINKITPTVNNDGYVVTVDEVEHFFYEKEKGSEEVVYDGFCGGNKINRLNIPVTRLSQLRDDFLRELKDVSFADKNEMKPMFKHLESYQRIITQHFVEYISVRI